MRRTDLRRRLLVRSHLRRRRSAPPNRFDGGGDAGRPPGTFQDICRFMRAIVVEDTARGHRSGAAGARFAPDRVRHVARHAAGFAVGPGCSRGRRAAALGRRRARHARGWTRIHPAVRYLDFERDARLRAGVGSQLRVGRAAVERGRPLAPAQRGDRRARFGVLQVVHEPIGGTFSLSVYGHEFQGTQAAAFYFTNMIAPNLKNGFAALLRRRVDGPRRRRDADRRRPLCAAWVGIGIATRVTSRARAIGRCRASRWRERHCRARRRSRRHQDADLGDRRIRRPAERLDRPSAARPCRRRRTGRRRR